MKRASFFTMFLLLSAVLLAQNVISKKNGKLIKCKIIEVNEDGIKYKLPKKSVVYFISKDDVDYFSYSPEGEKNYFEEKDVESNEKKTVQTQEGNIVKVSKDFVDDCYCNKGILDAQTTNQYSKYWYRGCFYGATIIGTIGAIIESSDDKIPESIDYKIDNEAYKKCYDKQFINEKNDALWSGWGKALGLVSSTLLLLLLL